jgi:4-methyl-5(b-hydroxyethyl)-thiazole monophosphate biosynthesis
MFANISVLVLLAAGFETEEATVPISYLTLAGATIFPAAVGPSRTVTDMSGLTYHLPFSVFDLANDTFDVVVVPGGRPACEVIANDALSVNIIARHAQEANETSQQKTLAAIGDATGVVVASAAHAVSGLRACGDPASDYLIADFGGIKQTTPAVVDKWLITARGPGIAQEFALQIITRAIGQDAADSVRRETQIENEEYPQPTPARLYLDSAQRFHTWSYVAITAGSLLFVVTAVFVILFVRLKAEAYSPL